MKKIITFLYLLILAYACYDDKGNYDYREINQISIQNIDSLVLCDQMDLLSIPVTFFSVSLKVPRLDSFLWNNQYRDWWWRGYKLWLYMGMSSRR